MGVNLHLSVLVSGYDPSRVGAIKQAIQAIFEREQLERDMSPLEESGDKAARILSSRSRPELPVGISGAYEWISEVQTLLSDAVVAANGGPCEVQFNGEDADEDEDEDEDDDDDEDEDFDEGDDE